MGMPDALLIFTDTHHPVEADSPHAGQLSYRSLLFHGELIDSMCSEAGLEPWSSCFVSIDQIDEEGILEQRVRPVEWGVQVMSRALESLDGQAETPPALMVEVKHLLRSLQESDGFRSFYFEIHA